MHSHLTAVIALGLLLAGCSDDVKQPEPGAERGPCYGNGTCNPGLICASNTCVRLPDAGGLDAAPSDAPGAPQPEAGLLDSAQLDQAVLCPDPYEPNESCADAKSLGASQGSTWVSVSATSSPAGDVDWFTASSQYPPTTCMPGTSRCYRFQVRLEVPAGQRLKVCLLRDDCNAVPSCADNATDPGPQQLEIHYEVEALCGFSLDTQAMISVEQIDAQAGCEQYSLSFIYDAC